MDKGFDLKVQELKENLVKTLNASNMPISVIDMVLTDLKANVSVTLQVTLEKQKKEFEDSQKKDKK